MTNTARPLMDWGDQQFGFEQQFGESPGPTTHALVRFIPAGDNLEINFGSTVHYGGGVQHRADGSVVISREQARQVGAALMGLGAEQLDEPVANRFPYLGLGIAAPTAPQAASQQAEQQANVPPPFAAPASLLNKDELAALRRFNECALDGEGYDVSKEMMQRLAEIGVVRRKAGAYYEHTEYGLAVLDGTHQTDIGTLVNSFLGWPLPASLHDDLGRIEKPIGTHLMNADEARAMFEFVLARRCRAQGGETNIESQMRAALAAPGAAQTAEPDLSTRQGKLRALADRIDHEKLWRTPGMYRDGWTDDQRARHEAGVMLRRYAEILQPGRWLIIPPTGPVRFSADTFEETADMVKRHQEREQ